MLIQRGKQIEATDYIAYGDWRNTVSRGAGQWWAEGYDVLVIPTVAVAAPELGVYQLHPGETVESWSQKFFNHVPYTQVWNATGQPAISLPLHTAQEGLPLGVMFVGAYGREDMLLRLASQLESAAPWRHKRPPISVRRNQGAQRLSAS
jgi:amidase